jgi:hypothetical protein
VQAEAASLELGFVSGTTLPLAEKLFFVRGMTSLATPAPNALGAPLKPSFGLSTGVMGWAEVTAFLLQPLQLGTEPPDSVPRVPSGLNTKAYKN